MIRMASAFFSRRTGFSCRHSRREGQAFARKHCSRTSAFWEASFLNGLESRWGQADHARQRGDGEDLRVKPFVIPELRKIKTDRRRSPPAAVLHFLDQPGRAF